MRLESIPLVLGVIIALVGLAIVFDAWADDVINVERRRFRRIERDRLGEAFVGLGVIAMAAALIGRDTWRYSILTTIAGAILTLWGVKRNGHYLKGALRR